MRNPSELEGTQQSPSGLLGPMLLSSTRGCWRADGLWKAPLSMAAALPPGHRSRGELDVSWMPPVQQCAPISLPICSDMAVPPPQVPDASRTSDPQQPNPCLHLSPALLTLGAHAASISAPSPVCHPPELLSMAAGGNSRSEAARPGPVGWVTLGVSPVPGRWLQ